MLSGVMKGNAATLPSAVDPALARRGDLTNLRLGVVNSSPDEGTRRSLASSDFRIRLFYETRECEFPDNSVLIS